MNKSQIFRKRIINTYIAMQHMVKDFNELDYIAAISKKPSKIFLDTIEFRQIDVEFVIFQMQLITDLYIQNKYAKTKGYVINSVENVLLDDALENKVVDSALKNKNICFDSYKATYDFYNNSAYYKVLLMKSLSEEDVQKLKDFNFMFEEEYNHFNVDITKEFIIRQINKWLHAFPDNNLRAFTETASFLIDLYNIDEDLVVDVVGDMIEELNLNIDEVIDSLHDKNIENLVKYLISYYELNKEIKPVRS